jgi:hypothetical protein
VTASAAPWVQAGTTEIRGDQGSEDLVIHFDQGTVQREGSLARVQLVFDQSTWNVSDGWFFDRIVQNAEVDCAKETITVLNTYGHGHDAAISGVTDSDKLYDFNWDESRPSRRNQVRPKVSPVAVALSKSSPLHRAICAGQGAKTFPTRAASYFQFLKDRITKFREGGDRQLLNTNAPAQVMPKLPGKVGLYHIGTFHGIYVDLASVRATAKTLQYALLMISSDYEHPGKLKYTRETRELFCPARGGRVLRSESSVDGKIWRDETVRAGKLKFGSAGFIGVANTLCKGVLADGHGHASLREAKDAYVAQQRRNGSM